MTSDRTTTPPAVLTVDHVAVIVGCANGLKTPAARVVITFEDAPERLQALRDGIATLGDVLHVTVPPRGQDPATVPIPEALLRTFVETLTVALVRTNACLGPAAAGSPQYLRIDPPTRAPDQPATRLLLVWPTDCPQFMAHVLKWSLDQCCAFADAPTKSDLIEVARQAWQQISVQLAKALPSGANIPVLLSAARALQVPVLWLGRDVMQVGQGRRGRLLRSTLTDATPSLGVTIARDKASTAQLLRLAGIPTPLHVEVADVDAALAAAERLGWPVVVKPADQDPGAGARANLRDRDQVVSAFASAERVSKRVLVEQHIVGNEYRLTVVHGELFWAHVRIPASANGDGVLSIHSLIDRENERRVQSLCGNANGLKPIEQKDSDSEFLQKTGWSLKDIPALEQTVRLQSIPTSMTGGGGHSWVQEIHPDNQRLAERAARLLRLDIAGVDLIMPDITRSWRDVGGAITEVNAIPQISTLTDAAMVERLLQKLVPGRGRIPLVFVLADGDAPAWVAALERRLTGSGLTVGLTCEAGLAIGDTLLRARRLSVTDDIKVLQVDPSVDVIVAVADGSGFLQTGLPFDAVDALVVQTFKPDEVQLFAPYCRGFRAIRGRDLFDRYQAAISTAVRGWQVVLDGVPEVRLVDAVALRTLRSVAQYREPWPPADVGPAQAPLLQAG